MDKPSMIDQHEQAAIGAMHGWIAATYTGFGFSYGATAEERCFEVVVIFVGPHDTRT